MFRLSSTKMTSFRSQSWIDLSSAASKDGSFLRSEKSDCFDNLTNNRENVVWKKLYNYM